MADKKLQSDYEKLLNKYEDLKNQMINVIETKESLLKHKFYHLKANYILKIGVLEHRLLDLDIKLGLIKRKIQLTQSHMKNVGFVNVTIIEFIANNEFENLFEFLKENEKDIDMANYLKLNNNLSDDKLNELNKYFRNIVMMLHPDINVRLTDTQLRLWEKAKIAYERAELEYLKILYKLAHDEAINSTRLEDFALDELSMRVDYLEARLKEEYDEIRSIQDDFPFNIAELLSDESKVKEVQSELRKNIELGANILKILEDHYLLMLTENKYLN